MRRSVLLVYNKICSSDTWKELRMLNYDPLLPSGKILGQLRRI